MALSAQEPGAGMEVLAVIPARGGSKGIPRKNVVPLCGKPMIGWTIEAARGAETVARVVVSTDDAEIGATARRFGADVVWRPEALSGDLASSESALLHALDTLAERESYAPDVLAFLQCTAPLTTAADIDGTVHALREQQAETALAVVDFHYFLWRGQGDDFVGVNHDKRTRLLRQQKPPEYLEAGAVYAMRTDGFRQHRHRFFGRTACHPIPARRCWEVDEPVDLEVAEVLLRRQLAEARRRALPPHIGALVMDFDGVFTDNRALVLEDGREAVLCDRSDGMAIAQLKQRGFPLLVLSSEVNPVVRARCDKLGIECLHGVTGKWPILKSWLDQRGIAPADVLYVGNDVNDLDCLQSVGCPIVVRDAQAGVKPAAQIVLSAAGGQGAIRELATLIQQHMQSREGARYVASA